MSGSVFLSNLDDFIALSQACVNPLVSARLGASNTSDAVDGPVAKSSKVTLSNDFSTTEFDNVAVEPNLIRSKVSSSSKTVAAVSLNDCLACR